MGVTVTGNDLQSKEREWSVAVIDEPTGMPTIRDVAARAGVALSSVSRVLSGHADVSSRMREKVERAVAELDYQPDFFAQSLRSGSSHTVGFMLRDISNPLFAAVAKYCEERLRSAGYAMLLTSSDAKPDAEAKNLALLRRRRVDGLVVSLVSESAQATRSALLDITLPVVLVDREVEGLDASAVLCNHAAGVRQAVRALLELGHRRVMLVTGSLDVRSSRERRRAYIEAHEEAALPVIADLMVFGAFEADFAEHEVTRRLEGTNCPTAIVAGGIMTTYGTLRAIRAHDLVPSQDIAVVALDEWPLFDVSAPPVASVSRDPAEMGTAAAELILERIDGRPRRTVVVPTRFYPRDVLTTAPLQRSEELSRQMAGFAPS